MNIQNFNINNLNNKIMENLQLNTTWLNGKHATDIEINTSLPYIQIGDYFVQGDQADEVINEIHEIWLLGFTVREAINIWACDNLG